MKPPLFDYITADSIDMAVAVWAQAGGEAKVIAGGKSLVPMLNFRLLRPAILVDINRIAGLAFIKETEKDTRVGAITRHYQHEHRRQEGAGAKVGGYCCASQWSEAGARTIDSIRA